jgi:hypothetical protein
MFLNDLPNQLFRVEEAAFNGLKGDAAVSQYIPDQAIQAAGRTDHTVKKLFPITPELIAKSQLQNF